MTGHGWYPDPQQPALVMRWWDGTSWTGHTQPIPPVRVPQPRETQAPKPAPPDRVVIPATAGGRDRNTRSRKAMGNAIGMIVLSSLMLLVTVWVVVAMFLPKPGEVTGTGTVVSTVETSWENTGRRSRGTVHGCYPVISAVVDGQNHRFTGDRSTQCPWRPGGQIGIVYQTDDVSGTIRHDHRTEGSVMFPAAFGAGSLLFLVPGIRSLRRELRKAPATTGTTHTTRHASTEGSTR